MRDLSTNDLRTKKFCRLFKHASNEWYTTEAISAATNWMKLNEFEEGACTNKNTLGTIHMEHLKEVNSNKWDDLYEELSDLMFNFTYDQLVCLDMLLNTLLAVHKTHSTNCIGCSWTPKVRFMISGMETTQAIESSGPQTK